MCLKCNKISKNVGKSIDSRIFSLSNTKPINRQRKINEKTACFCYLWILYGTNCSNSVYSRPQTSLVVSN